MSQRRPGLSVIVLAVASLASSAGFAGLRTGYAVVLDATAGTASGNMTFVHNTPDAVQSLVCSVEGGNYGFCEAQNVAGVQGSCYTYDPNMYAAILSVNSFSYVTFSWNTSTGQCTFVQVANDSTTGPKGQ